MTSPEYWCLTTFAEGLLAALDVVQPPATEADRREAHKILAILTQACDTLNRLRCSPVHPTLDSFQGQFENFVTTNRPAPPSSPRGESPPPRPHIKTETPDEDEDRPVTPHRAVTPIIPQLQNITNLAQLRMRPVPPAIPISELLQEQIPPAIPIAELLREQIPTPTQPSPSTTAPLPPLHPCSPWVIKTEPRSPTPSAMTPQQCPADNPPRPRRPARKSTTARKRYPYSADPAWSQPKRRQDKIVDTSQVAVLRSRLRLRSHAKVKSLYVAKYGQAALHNILGENTECDLV